MIGRAALELRAVPVPTCIFGGDGRDLDAPVGERVGELEGRGRLAGRVGAELRGPEGAIGEVAADDFVADAERRERTRAPPGPTGRSRGCGRTTCRSARRPGCSRTSPARRYTCRRRAPTADAEAASRRSLRFRQCRRRSPPMTAADAELPPKPRKPKLPSEAREAELHPEIAELVQVTGAVEAAADGAEPARSRGRTDCRDSRSRGRAVSSSPSVWPSAGRQRRSGRRSRSRSRRRRSSAIRRLATGFLSHRSRSASVAIRDTLQASRRR